LRTMDDEEFRRHQGRELNKGEAAHDLSRFLFFGKEAVAASRGCERGLAVSSRSARHWYGSATASSIALTGTGHSRSTSASAGSSRADALTSSSTRPRRSRRPQK
jgi:hypothetical protein